MDLGGLGDCGGADSSKLSFHLANGLFTKAAKESMGFQVPGSGPSPCDVSNEHGAP